MKEDLDQEKKDGELREEEKERHVVALEGVVLDMNSLMKARAGRFMYSIAKLKASHKEKISQMQGQLVKVREEKSQMQGQLEKVMVEKQAAV